LKYLVEYNTFKEINLQQVNEGSLAIGLITDTVQFLLGAAAEYGIAAGTLGAGTPAAVAVETVIDTGFAAQSITSTIDQVTNLKGQFDKFTEIVNKCMESFEIFKSGNLEKFYSTIKQIIIDGIGLIKDGEESVDKLAEKFKDLISNLISKITDAVGKGLKILIPDATVGLALTASLKVVVEVASENGYTIAQKAVEQLGEYKKYLINPEEFPALIRKTLPDLYNLIDGFKKKIEEMGWTRAIVSFGTNGLILKKLGPAGLDKLAQTIKSYEPKVLDLIEKILGVVVPVTFTFLAIAQILLKGEYKSEEVKGDEKESKEKPQVPEKS
jgi:hypothetical protein